MDMKKILQAFDSASTKKPVEGADDMKRFVSIISEANDPESKKAHDAGYRDAAQGKKKNPYNPGSPSAKHYDDGQEAHKRHFGETVINSFDEDTVGGDANSFLLAADKINDEVMAQINKIKINADEALLRDLMDKFNNFMTAYHAVGKDIIQPDMFNDSMGEAANAAQQAAIAVNMKKKGQKPKSEGLSFKDYAALAEAKKKMSAKDDPCWSGYKMVGTKKKGGKEVPNCVPGKKGD